MACGKYPRDLQRLLITPCSSARLNPFFVVVIVFPSYCYLYIFSARPCSSSSLYWIRVSFTCPTSFNLHQSAFPSVIPFVRASHENVHIGPCLRQIFMWKAFLETQCEPSVPFPGATCRRGNADGDQQNRLEPLS